MTAGRRICEIIHAAALGVWLGALVMAGAGAAVVFPTLKDLNPRLPEYDKYTGDHWLLAGGQVVQRIFLVADAVQFICALIAGLTFGIAAMWLGLPMRRVSTFARAAFLLALVALLSYRFAVVQPKWDYALHQHWAEARAGDNAAAAKFKAELDPMHPLQTGLMTTTAGLVLAALIAATASVRSERRADGEAVV